MKYFFLVIPFVLSAIFFGGVHPLYQVSTAAMTLFFPSFLLWKRRPRVNAQLFWAVLAILTVMLATLIPVPIAIHRYLFPDQTMLEKSFILLEVKSYPLTVQPFEQLTALIIGLLAFLMCMASAQVLKSTKEFQPFAKTLLITVAGFILLGILQRLTNADSIFWMTDVPVFSKKAFFGPWIYPNHAAVVMAMTLPLVMAQNAAKWRWSMLLLWLVGLTLAQSRGGWLAAYVGMMFYGLMAWPKRVALILPIGLLLNGLPIFFLGSEWLGILSDMVRYTPNEVVDGGRNEIWYQGLPLLKSAPFLGIGYGSLEDFFETVRTTTHYSRTSHLHSEPMEILISHGFLVGSALLALWGRALFMGYKKLKSLESKSEQYIHWLAACWSGLIALTVQSLIDLSFRSSAVVLLAALLLGPCCRSRKALPRYISNGPTLALILISGFAIHMHNSPESRYSYSEYWMKQGDTSSGQFAAKAYRTAALSRPMYSRAYRQLALNLHQDRPNHTTVLLEHAAQLAPNQFVNWMALAEVYTQQQACPAAWAAWKRTTDLKMETIDAFRRRIPALFSCGSIEDAAQVIRPGLPKQKAEVALWLGQNGHWAVAKSMMDEALVEDKRLTPLAAEFYYNAKDFKKAWSFAQENSIENCQSVLTKAKILTMLYNPIEAEQFYIQAKAFCGDKTSIRNGLNTVRLQQGRKDELEKALNQIKESPKMHGLRRNIMNAISQTEDHSALIPHYEQLFEFKQLTSDEQIDLIRLYSGQSSTIWPKSSPIH